MIELHYTCHNCDTYMSRLVSYDSDPEEIDECIFCGGDDVRISMNPYDPHEDDSSSDEHLFTMLFAFPHVELPDLLNE